jgi:hypothetical protein
MQIRKICTKAGSSLSPCASWRDISHHAGISGLESRAFCVIFCYFWIGKMVFSARHGAFYRLPGRFLAVTKASSQVAGPIRHDSPGRPGGRNGCGWRRITGRLLHRVLRWPPPLLEAVAGREYHYRPGKVMAKRPAISALRTGFPALLPARECRRAPSDALSLIGLARQRTVAAGYGLVKVRCEIYLDIMRNLR